MTVAQRKRPARHQCPPWCHTCPDIIAACVGTDGFPGWAKDESELDDDDKMMPFCMGGAVYGWSNCYCDQGPPAPDRPKPTVRVELTHRQWSELERRSEREGVDAATLAARMLGNLLCPPRRKPELAAVPSIASVARGSTEGPQPPKDAK